MINGIVLVRIMISKNRNALKVRIEDDLTKNNEKCSRIVKFHAKRAKVHINTRKH